VQTRLKKKKKKNYFSEDEWNLQVYADSWSSQGGFQWEMILSTANFTATILRFDDEGKDAMHPPSPADWMDGWLQWADEHLVSDQSGLAVIKAMIDDTRSIGKRFRKLPQIRRVIQLAKESKFIFRKNADASGAYRWAVCFPNEEKFKTKFGMSRDGQLKKAVAGKTGPDRSVNVDEPELEKVLQNPDTSRRRLPALVCDQAPVRPSDRPTRSSLQRILASQSPGCGFSSLLVPNPPAQDQETKKITRPSRRNSHPR